ncbi:MAG: molybdopterin molybdotransferase MoeA [Candidatus Bathyarchaeia archaeon]
MHRADQKRSFKLISYPEALDRLFEAFQGKHAGYETVPVEEAVDRVSAENIMAQSDIPQTNQAIVDGYAVKSRDLAEASPTCPVMLRVAGKLYPWDISSNIELLNGQAFYVTCGAPLPLGADAVAMVENTILHNGEIEIRTPVKKGDNVAYAGEDLKRGSLIIEKGDVLRPQDIGVLAGLGLKRVKVFKKPKVAIIATGNELFELSRRDPTRIADNYALIISGLISKLGGAPVRLGIAPDDLYEIKKKIEEAVKKADIIVTIGGCSVGEKDLVPDAVNSFGKPGILVHGIKTKPGRVTGFGIVRGKPIVMLPGLFASTMAGFYLILTPLIRLYTGFKKECPLPIITAKINQDVETDEKPHHRFLSIHVKRADGSYIAEVVAGGASSLSRFINSNGFILVPPKKTLKRGEEVKVTLFSKEEFIRILD